MNQFSYPNFPNNNRIPLAVSALQHIPFRIDGSGSLLPSLIVLRQNNRYWEVLEVAAKRTRQWSIPVAMNIVWVLVAFSLTIVDSFVDFSYFIAVPGDAGYSIAAVWTYLLPLVVGWLHVGSQPEANHLRNALDEAHNTAYMATASKPILATQVNGGFARAIEFSTKHINYINADEEKTAPIFNYSRVFVWSQSAEYILTLYQHAAAKAEQRIAVQGEEWMGGDEATPNHNWTGNEAEIMQYCTAGRQALVHPNPSDPQPPIPLTPYSAFPPSARPSAMTLPTAVMHTNADAFAHRLPSSTSLKFDEEIPSKHDEGAPSKYDEETPSKYDEEAPSTEVRAVLEKPVFATGVFQRVVVATVLALGLQWGTTGASILIHVNTPPKGIGCRATTFTVYGVAATLAFWLLLFSSVLAHLARRQSVREKRSSLKTFIGYIAVLTRWLGKFIAIINGFGILISCIMQFAGVYDSCFCPPTFSGGTQTAWSRLRRMTPGKVKCTCIGLVGLLWHLVRVGFVPLRYM